MKKLCKHRDVAARKQIPGFLCFRVGVGQNRKQILPIAEEQGQVAPLVSPEGSWRSSEGGGQWQTGNVPSFLLDSPWLIWVTAQDRLSRASPVRADPPGIWAKLGPHEVQLCSLQRRHSASKVSLRARPCTWPFSAARDSPAPASLPAPPLPFQASCFETSDKWKMCCCSDG